MLIDPANPIKNGKIVSAIRQRIAEVLDIRELQKLLYDKWGGSLKDKDLCLTDATCYESHLRFPTDVKLLWECCEWLQSLLKKTCKILKERLPRNKYRDIDRARLTYAKHRKHSRAATAKLRCRLLSLLFQTDRAMEQNLQNTHRRHRAHLRAKQASGRIKRSVSPAKRTCSEKGGETPHCQHRPSLHPSHRQR